jgi:hypothetical protein
VQQPGEHRRHGERRRVRQWLAGQLHPTGRRGRGPSPADT